MPNNPDIPDTGRIQRDPSRTGKNSKLEYETNESYDEKIGSNVSSPPDDPATDRAIHDAVAQSQRTKRNQLPDEKLPHDKLDPDFGNDKIPET